MSATRRYISLFGALLLTLALALATNVGTAHAAKNDDRKCAGAYDGGKKPKYTKGKCKVEFNKSSYSPGDTVRFDSDEAFKPHDQVTGRLRCDGETKTFSYTADGKGEVGGSFKLPKDTPTGKCTFTLTGSHGGTASGQFNVKKGKGHKGHAYTTNGDYTYTHGQTVPAATDPVFTPGERVHATWSNGTDAGWFVVGPDGTLVRSFSVPNSVPTGSRSLTFTGQSSGASAVLGLTVTNQAASRLPFTGGSATLPLTGAGAGMVLAGGLTLLALRRRRAAPARVEG